MNTNLFDDVKDRVKMPELVQYYGINVNRAGMCECPFHEDKDPSMKVYEDNVHCFGCGAHEDGVGFVARFFDLSQIEAAKKINEDFHLGLEADKPLDKAQASEYMMKREKEAAERRAYEQWENGASNTLSTLNKTMQDWLYEYAPKSPEEMGDPDERYMFAIDHAAIVEDNSMRFLAADKTARIEMKPMINEMSELLKTAYELNKIVEVQRSELPTPNELENVEQKEMPTMGLFSVVQSDDERFYKSAEITANELLSTANGSDKPFLSLMEKGERITPEEFAEIQQSDKFKFSVEFDFNSNTANVYAVNNGKGGISDENRTEENTFIKKFKLTSHERNEPAQDKSESTLSPTDIKSEQPITDNIENKDNSAKDKGKDESKMPVMDNEKGDNAMKISAEEEEILRRAEEIRKKLEAENTNPLSKAEDTPTEPPKTEFYNTAEHDKLLPFLNAKAEFHEMRLDTLKGKRDTQSEKIAKNETKIAKLTDKANRLEDINKALGLFAESVPAFKALIENNERKINDIRSNKIPNRESKIAEHRQKIVEIDRKSEIIGHKLDRAVALSDTIKSFATLGADRRERFAEAMDRLHGSTLDCLNDKRNDLLFNIDVQKGLYQSSLTTTADKFDIQNKISKMQNNLTDIENKITKIADKGTYAHKTADQIDNAMKDTADIVNKAAQSGDINVAKLSENICLSDNGVSRNIEENEVSDNYLKNTEMAMEGNYNSIDGILNNGAGSQEIPGTYDEVERAADEMARMQNNEEKKQPEREAQEQVSDRRNNTLDWLTNMVADGKAEIDKDGKFKIDPQYYKNIDKNDRQTFEFSREDSLKLMSELNSNGVEFSAVSRKDGKVAVTVTKDDLQDIQAAAAELNVKPINAKAPEKAENKQYFFSIPKEERVTFSASEQSAQNIQKELNERGIMFSSYETKNNVKITVAKADQKAVNEICRKEMFINPELYAQLGSKERFTQRMDEQTARQAVNELKAAGIEHSAVFKGDKSGVTIRQSDYKKASNTRSFSAFMKQRINEVKEKPHENKDTKTKNRGQAI